MQVGEDRAQPGEDARQLGEDSALPASDGAVGEDAALEGEDAGTILLADTARRGPLAFTVGCSCGHGDGDNLLWALTPFVAAWRRRETRFGA